jgi:hypothetical protein
MAPRKRKCIARVNPNSLRMKLLRAAETPQQRQARITRILSLYLESRETPGITASIYIIPFSLYDLLKVTLVWQLSILKFTFIHCILGQHLRLCIEVFHCRDYRQLSFIQGDGRGEVTGNPKLQLKQKVFKTRYKMDLL